jgi:hypothetical protein
LVEKEKQEMTRQELLRWIGVCVLIAGICWEICNIQRIGGNRQTTDRQTTDRRIQNREEENAETKQEERRVDVELSLLIFNLGVQCYILSMGESMTIQH